MDDNVDMFGLWRNLLLPIHTQHVVVIYTGGGFLSLIVEKSCWTIFFFRWTVPLILYDPPTRPALSSVFQHGNSSWSFQYRDIFLCTLCVSLFPSSLACFLSSFISSGYSSLSAFSHFRIQIQSIHFRNVLTKSTGQIGPFVLPPILPNI